MRGEGGREGGSEELGEGGGGFSDCSLWARHYSIARCCLVLSEVQQCIRLSQSWEELKLVSCAIQ